MKVKIANALIWVFYFFLGIATGLVIFKLGSPLAVTLNGFGNPEQAASIIRSTQSFLSVSFPVITMLIYPVYFISAKYVGFPSYVVLFCIAIVIYLTRLGEFDGQIYFDALKLFSLAGFFVVAIICPKYGLKE